MRLKASGGGAIYNKEEKNAAPAYPGIGIREGACNEDGFMGSKYRYRKRGVSCGVLHFCPQAPDKAIKGRGCPAGCCRDGDTGGCPWDDGMGIIPGKPGGLWGRMGW